MRVCSITFSVGRGLSSFAFDIAPDSFELERLSYNRHAYRQQLLELEEKRAAQADLTADTLAAATAQIQAVCIRMRVCEYMHGL